MWTKAFAAMLLAAVVVVVIAGDRDTPVRRALLPQRPAGELALDRTADEVRLEGVPFDEAVKTVERLYRATLFVDWASVDAFHLDRRRPVSVARRNAPLREVLGSILSQMSTDAPALAFAPDGDAVLIMSDAAFLSRPHFTRVYDVRDMSGPAGIGDVVDMVRETVDPASWRSAGGNVGGILNVGGRLIVTQSPENHRGIERLLEQLREPPPPFEPPSSTEHVYVWHQGLGEWTPRSPTRAESALGRTVPELQLDAVPLDEALEAVRRQWGVKLYVKWNELDAAGFDQKAAVAVDLQNVKLRDALDAVLRDHRNRTGNKRLDHRIRSGVITIEPAELINNDPKDTITHVYDMRDWAAAHGPATRPAAANDRGGPAWAAAMEQLVDAVMDSVDPGSWRDRGGSVGSVRELAGQLIVTQTGENQERVRRLLNALRFAATTRPATQPAGPSTRQGDAP